MADRCCQAPQPSAADRRGYRPVLWLVLALHAVMFAVELLAGLGACPSNRF